MNDWIVEGASAHEDGYRDEHAVRVVGDMVIVNAVGATSEENVVGEVEIPVDVVLAVLRAAGHMSPVR